MCYWSSLRGSGGSSGTTVTFGRMTQELCCHSPPSRCPLPPCWTLSAAYCPICCLQNRQKKNVGEILVGNRDGGEKHHIHESLMPQFYRGKSSNTVKVRDSIINAIKCMDLCCWRLFREFLQNILYKKYIYLQVFCGNITRFCELIICEVYRLDRSQNRTEKCSVICGKGQDSVYIHSIFSETCFSI